MGSLTPPIGGFEVGFGAVSGGRFEVLLSCSGCSGLLLIDLKIPFSSAALALVADFLFVSIEALFGELFIVLANVLSESYVA